MSHKKQEHNSFQFSKNDIFGSFDIETTNNIEKPQIYAVGLMFQRNALQKCFDLAEWNNYHDLLIKRDIHIRQRSTNFSQHADFICSTKIANIMHFLLSTKKNLKIITQNGSKFDLRYLLYLIPKMGGIWKEKCEDDDFRAHILNNHHKQEIDIGNFTYSYLCDENKKIFYIEIITEQEQKILFFDDYLIMKASLKEKGKLLGLNKLENENDYQVTQPYNCFQDYLNDKNELTYLRQDCAITLFSFRKFFLNFIAQENSMCFGITASSIAFKTWKKYFALSIIKQWIKDKILQPQSQGRYGYYYNINDIKQLNNLTGRKSKGKAVTLIYLRQAIYKKYFNDAEIADEYLCFSDLKKRFAGGYTLLNSDNTMWIKLLIDDLKLWGYDVNSMYSFIMNSHFLCPYGFNIPHIKVIDKTKYQFFTFTAKKNMHTKMSPIFFTNVTTENQKLRSWNQHIKKDERLYVTTDMLDNIEERYGLSNFDIKVDYTYNSKPFSFFFGTFVQKFYELKKNAQNQIEKATAKLLLNSAFGKFGSNMYVYKKYYDANTNDYILAEDKQRGYFMPMAIAITSTARSYLQKITGKIWKRVVYCDTDSMKIIATKEEITEIEKTFEIDTHKLGAFKFEYVADTWIFKRTKNYFAFNHEEQKCYYANNSVNWPNEWLHYEKEHHISFIDEASAEKTMYKWLHNYFMLQDLLSGYDLQHQKDNINIVGVGVSIFETSSYLQKIWEMPNYEEQKIKGDLFKEMVYNNFMIYYIKKLTQKESDNNQWPSMKSKVPSKKQKSYTNSILKMLTCLPNTPKQKQSSSITMAKIKAKQQHNQRRIRHQKYQ